MKYAKQPMVNYALGDDVFTTQIVQALGGRVTAGKAGWPKNLISCKQHDELLHTKLQIMKKCLSKHLAETCASS